MSEKLREAYMVFSTPSSGLLTDVVDSLYSSENTISSVCQLFGASAGCFWQRNSQSGHQVFHLIAHYGRPDLDRLISEKNTGRRHKYILRYDVDKGTTASSYIFSRRTAISGHLGDAPFSEGWLALEHTEGLPSLGISGISLVPIFDDTDDPIGSISLYFSKGVLLPSADTLNAFSRYFSTLWRNSHVRIEDLRLDASLLRHEIYGDIKSLKNTAAKLSNSLTAVRDRDERRYMRRHISDIRKRIQSISATISDIGLFDRAHVNSQANHSTALSDQMNSITAPLIREYPRNRVTLDPVFYSRSRIDINIHPDDLGHILRNLAENAFKYSSGGFPVKIRTSEIDGQLDLTFSNVSPPMPEEEWRAAWNPRVRGTRQKDSDSDDEGTGLGLYVVRQICRIYGLKYKMWQDPMQHVAGELVWTRVRISFPPDRTRLR